LSADIARNVATIRALEELIPAAMGRSDANATSAPRRRAAEAKFRATRRATVAT
jgi:hypothetical protein